MTDPIRLDPAFEALLREVASDPRSSLLRIERPTKLVGLFTQEEAVRPTATGLTAAERHLLRVYRGEVAGWLRQASLQQLMEGTHTGRFLRKYRDPGRRWDQGLRRWDDLGRSASPYPRCEDEPLQTGRAALRRWVRGKRSLPAYHLAALASRIEPGTKSSLIAAISMTLERRPEPARRLFRFVLDRSCSGLEKTRCWEGLAHLALDVGRLGEALEAEQSGGALGADPVGPNINLFALALKAGAEALAVRAGAMIDEHGQAADSMVTASLHNWSSQRLRGDWHPTPEGRALAQRLRDRLHENGRRLADAYAQA